MEPTAAQSTSAVLESFNPATGELIAAVPTITPSEVQGIVDEVAVAQRFWGQLSVEERSQYLRKIALTLVDNIDELAMLLAREQGKPLTEAYMMELMPTADAIRWTADNAPKILKDEKVPYRQPWLFGQKRGKFRYEALGVVGVIAPWNYPWTIPVGEVVLALAAGNGVVLKPASLTCLIGQKIQEIFEKGGLPKGLLRVVHGGGAVGQALVESSARKIFFTGSVEVGRHVGETCAHLMKESVLELGGKDPMIVLSDADIARAVDGAAWGGFANGGQTCSGIERVYVMHDVAAKFIDGLVARASALKVGDPLEWSTEIGPMTSHDQYVLVKELVDDAVASGATLHCGGPVAIPGMSGDFYAPAVLTGVNHSMRIMQEEIFGPVIPVITVDSADEALRLSNDSEFGLGASVWTSDRECGEAIASELESGTVWINEHLYSHGTCQCSWGGVKNSGIGRSHSKWGLYECVNVKHVAWDASRMRAPWWFPYDDSTGPALQATTKLLYGRKSQRLSALTEGAKPLMKFSKRLAADALSRRK